MQLTSFCKELFVLNLQIVLLSQWHTGYQTMVLAISDGKLMEYDEPKKLMEREGSLFGQLVKEYWSQCHSAESH
ncbi:hypothetical protein PVK06_037158 [Gossypium arboreum]|uniref:Uncharacterized protein n=1 Tax=Gossypium arboreum TaxID=29729 RepID=A0ABR0MX23_GOSAR|nr:hypothetical protein PVK06_037158 [Gossypium arboreum]